MATRVYGCSDDLVEFEGDVSGEISPNYDKPVFVTFSDGTRLRVFYGKKVNGKEEGIWEIRVMTKGTLFDRIDECFEETDAPDGYSDSAYFRDGLEWAKAHGKRVR